MNTTCLFDLIEKERRCAKKINIFMDTLCSIQKAYKDGCVSKLFLDEETERYIEDIRKAEDDLMSIRLEMKKYFQNNGFGFQWI